MKILMATMKMEIGGAETHILELAKELAAQGVDVTVVSAGGVYAKELEAAGIAHVWAPLHTRHPASVLRAAAILRRRMRFTCHVWHKRSMLSTEETRSVRKRSTMSR